MQTPLVSILVTVYNRELYLRETLQSILDSTYDYFEVVVVDDYSTDKSVDIAREFANLDQRVTVHQNYKNLGDYPNRMKAASLAQGRYLKYVDSDDLIYPHSLAIMVESMERFPEAALGLCHSMPEDESPYPWQLSPEQAYRKQFLGRGCLNCGPSGAIIRRDAFQSIGGFQAHWKVISDTNLWYRMAARWPIVLLPPGLVWWRRHEQQEFTSNDNPSVYLDKGYKLDKQALTDSGCPLGDQDRAAALARRRQHIARRLISLVVKDGKVRLAFRMAREAKLSPIEIMGGLRRYR